MTSVWKIGDIGRPSIAILIALIAFLLPRTGIAGHGEEANAVIDRWSAAYSANDPDAITKNYRPDAILLGT